MVGALAVILLPLATQPIVLVDGLFVTLAELVAVHAVNAYRGLPVAVPSTIVVVSAAVGSTAVVPAPPGQQAGNLVWVLAVFAATAAAGQVLRAARIRAVAEQAAADAAERYAERRLLARELHDVVSHAVAVMTVQAGAAQLLLDADPTRASSLLESVQQTGEQSASELCRLLDLMGGDHPGLDPQPQLADLPALIRQVREAGLPAHLTTLGVRDVTPGLQVTAYRVVQESLTNALKHGVRSDVSVAVRGEDDSLTVTIDDAGRTFTERASTGGHGLQGMAERVRLYGGTLVAGPDAGRWRVRAILPLEAQRRSAPITPDPKARRGGAQ
ncbi:MAG: histidine kinase [Pedococcus sp.]